MPLVCSRDGHLLEEVEGEYCPEHEAPIFTSCSNCEVSWSVITAEEGLFKEWGAHFCVDCAHPGPWVSRQERIAWLKHRLHEQNLDSKEVLRLQTIFDKLAEMDPDDSKTFVAWNHIKRAAPGLWDLVLVIPSSTQTLARFSFGS